MRRYHSHMVEAEVVGGMAVAQATAVFARRVLGGAEDGWCLPLVRKTAVQTKRCHCGCGLGAPAKAGLVFERLQV